MLRFVLRRLLQTIPVLFVIITATFFMVRFVPGGPFTAEKAIPPEILRNLEAHYGLDQPLWRQYLSYLGKIARGDLGPSFKYPNRTVNEIIGDKLPVSLELGGWALLVALSLGLPLGVLAAVKRNTVIDYLCSAVGMIGICVPTFVLGPLLALSLGIYLHWFNVSGWYGPTDRILPGITLGFVYAAYIMRLTRGGMLEVLNQDFIRTARAKGASEARIVLHHALRGGLLPVVAFLGPGIAGILTGSFVIETIFQIPGLGREFVNIAFNRDYTLVLGTVILYASLIVVCNLVVDVVQV
ncbi:MAG TPA: ABC transporter permease subunit, partial [Lacunisphaera sp.]